ncbi:MAG: hypothetical protein IK076_01175, partial [Bacteroidales bacterium]|nr:hypothetical protein [Bacteroidales bacterium]
LGFHRGVADELYSFFERMPSSALEGKEVIVGSGNAVRRNKLLREVLESRFGLGLTLSPASEEAATGAAMTALSVTGRSIGVRRPEELENLKWAKD